MKRIVFLFIIMSALLFAMQISVSAEETYGVADIERIYIQSDTSLKTLAKTYVPAKIEIVRKDGTVEISDEAATVKLRGNSTAKAEKKPFKIKFSAKQSVFGMDKGKKWNLLANAFDKTLIRNKLALDLADKLGLSYISQSTFADVYYNGVLKGNYLVTEPVEAGTNKVDIEESENSSDFMIELERERYESDVTYVQSGNGVRFAVNVPEEPTATQKSGIENYLANVETALKTYKFSEYSKYIDVDSFVNYYIACEIFKAVDFNYSSTRFYVKNGRMYAGPIWDVDLSSGNASSSFYRAYYSGAVSYKTLFCTEMKWYGYLIKSDEFVGRVNKRLAEMYPVIENMYKTNALGTNQIDMLTTTYQDSFARNYSSVSGGGAGWSLTKRYSVCDNPKGLELDPQPATYKESVDLLRNWLANRVGYLKNEWAGIKNNYVDMLEVEKKTYNSVHLSWYNNGVSDGNEIYAKTEKGKYILLKTVYDGFAQECTVKKIKPGIKYTFKVRSFVKIGNEKEYTDFVFKTKKIKLKAPKVKIKTLSQTKKKLTWNKIKGAEGYLVYFGTKKNNLKIIKTLNGNGKVTYTKSGLIQSKNYYFKVKAFVKSDGKRYFSN